MTKKFFILFTLFIIILINNKCTTNFPAFPTGGPCAFIVQEPQACFTKVNGNQKIKMLVNIVTKFYDPNNGGRITPFADESLEVDPNLTPFPVSLTASIPNTGIIFEVEVNVVGQDCSTCANGWSDPNETPYGVCLGVNNTTTTPWTTRAAKPRWRTSFRYSGGYITTLNSGPIGKILNLPNTCGCNVPWN